LSEGWLAGTENWNPPPAAGGADDDGVEKGEEEAPKLKGLAAEKENGEDVVATPAVEVAGLGTENANGAGESLAVIEVVVAVETPKLNPPKAGLGAGFSPIALRGSPKLSLGASSDPEVAALVVMVEVVEVDLKSELVVAPDVPTDPFGRDANPRAGLETVDLVSVELMYFFLIACLLSVYCPKICAKLTMGLLINSFSIFLTNVLFRAWR
jgi:hypothetical protein